VGEIELARPPLGPEKASRGARRMRHPDRRARWLAARLARPPVDGCDLADLLLREGGRRPGKRADEPGLPGTRGADEQEMVPAGKRDLKGRRLAPSSPRMILLGYYPLEAAAGLSTASSLSFPAVAGRGSRLRAGRSGR